MKSHKKTKFFATICYNMLHSTDNNCAHSPRSRSSSLQLKANPSIRFSASLSYSYTLSHHTTFHLTRHITTTTPLHWQLYFLPTLFSTKRIFCVHYRLCWERKNEKSSKTIVSHSSAVLKHWGPVTPRLAKDETMAEAVASAGPYANYLNLALVRNPCRHIITQFLQAGCSTNRTQNYYCCYRHI